MNASENCANDANGCSAGETSGRNSITGAHAALSRDRRFKRAGNGRSDGTNAPGVRPRLRNSCRSLFWNLIRLVEGKSKVEDRVPCRRNAGSMGQCGETDAALSPARLDVPVESKSG